MGLEHQAAPFKQVRIVCRQKQLSTKTEKTYRFWTRQYILFHGKRYPNKWVSSKSRPISITTALIQEAGTSR